MDFLIPMLGLIFLPFTTLIYVLVYDPIFGLTFWDWFLIGFAFIIDMGSYAGSVYTNKKKILGVRGDSIVEKEEIEEAEIKEKK